MKTDNPREGWEDGNENPAAKSRFLFLHKFLRAVRPHCHVPPKMGEGSSAALYAQQLGSFLTLVVIQSVAMLLFKVCQVNGQYTFSPASSVALTELCKLGMAATLHQRERASSGRPYFEALSPKIVLHYLGLALLYTLNNTLSFWVLAVADPGTMSLGKSVAPYLCALLLRLSGQAMSGLQWVCIVIQCCAIAIVQYDVCKGGGVLPAKAALPRRPTAHDLPHRADRPSPAGAVRRTTSSRSRCPSRPSPPCAFAHLGPAAARSARRPLAAARGARGGPTPAAPSARRCGTSSLSRASRCPSTSKT